jgi:hypothetical protein
MMVVEDMTMQNPVALPHAAGARGGQAISPSAFNLNGECPPPTPPANGRGDAT